MVKVARKVAQTEAPVLQGCLALLRLRGWFHWRNNTGAVRHEGRFLRYGKVGSSDILSVVPRSGRLMVVECKRPGGRPTEAQERFLDSVRVAGGVALVVDDIKILDRAIGLLETDPWLEFPGGVGI